MNAAAQLQIYINGELRVVAADQALSEVIAGFGLPPQSVLVEHNGRALLRSEWGRLRLADNDRLEILRVVAGG